MTGFNPNAGRRELAAPSECPMLQTRACLRGEFPMAFSTAGRGPLKAEMNVTPMIDVLLVLIIVFMVVVASISKSRGLETQIPQPATKLENASTPRTVVIQLAWTGKDNPPSLKIND